MQSGEIEKHICNQELHIMFVRSAPDPMRAKESFAYKVALRLAICVR